MRLGILFLLLTFTSCDFGTGQQVSPPVTTSQVIADISTKVIFATYTDIALKADSMQQAVNRLAQTPNAANLAAAQQAWKNARIPWESSEGFLFGPVETIPIDAPIDSWPLNQVDLDKVLKSSVSITKGYVDSLDFSLKGFHTIEYLLFGDSANDSAIVRYPANLTARQLEYLKASTASFVTEINKLVQAWSPTGGNFLGELQNAGQGSRTYTTRKQALQELLNGIINICSEVANEKMYHAYRFDPPDLNQEESRFSNNSTTDFANNIRSVRNVYLGRYGNNSGAGLKALLETKNPGLAALVSAQIDSAIAATEAMGFFGADILNGRNKIDSASTAIRKLRATLDTAVGPALNDVQ